MVFRGPASEGSGAASKNAVVMSNGVLDWERPETWTGMIDRSPCGALESQPDSPRRLEASLLHAASQLRGEVSPCSPETVVRVVAVVWGRDGDMRGDGSDVPVVQ